MQHREPASDLIARPIPPQRPRPRRRAGGETIERIPIGSRKQIAGGRHVSGAQFSAKMHLRKRNRLLQLRLRQDFHLPVFGKRRADRRKTRRMHSGTSPIGVLFTRISSQWFAVPVTRSSYPSTTGCQFCRRRRCMGRRFVRRTRHLAALLRSCADGTYRPVINRGETMTASTAAVRLAATISRWHNGLQPKCRPAACAKAAGMSHCGGSRRLVLGRSRWMQTGPGPKRRRRIAIWRRLTLCSAPTPRRCLPSVWRTPGTITTPKTSCKRSS